MTASSLPITVIIPAFNRARLLPRTLASVAAQRPRGPAEVIVIDDASTDDTAEVAESLGAGVLRHPVNRGPAAARNTGFAAASQPWVAQLDSDDEWLPHYLETLWELRDGHVLVCGASIALLPDGGHRFNGTMSRRPQVIGSPATLIFPDNFVASSGVMLRTQALRDVVGYRAGARHAEDLDLWVRLLERGTGVASPRVVTRYHVHSEQATRDAGAMFEGHRRVIAAFAGRPWSPPELARRWTSIPAWDRVKSAGVRGRWAEALREMLHLVRDLERVVGLAELLVFRVRARRRSSAVDEWGEPTVAIFPGTSVSPLPRDAVDLRTTGWWGALPALARRPTGRAIVGSRRHALLARSLGIAPVRYRT
jgi:glycosyltransferase involved in cell wall biosynthesis